MPDKLSGFLICPFVSITKNIHKKIPVISLINPFFINQTNNLFN